MFTRARNFLVRGGFKLFAAKRSNVFPRSSGLAGFSTSQQQYERLKQFSDNEIQKISKMEELNVGLQYANEKKFDLAETYLEKAINKLQEQEFFNPSILLYAFKKFSLVQAAQGKYSELLSTFEQMYFINLSNAGHSNPDYLIIITNLLILYCNNDVARGNIFADMVLAEHSKDPIPLAFLKDILVFIGTLKILNNEYEIAIKLLKEALEMKLSSIPRGFLPFKSSLKLISALFRRKLIQRVSEQLSQQNADPNTTAALEKELQDFQQNYHSEWATVLTKFKEAVENFEIKDEIPAEDQISMKEYASLKKLLLKGELETSNSGNLKVEDIVLKNPYSCKVFMNAGEVLLLRNALEYSSFWLMSALNNSTKLGNMREILRCVVLSAIVSDNQNKPEFAEKLFRDCLDYSDTMKAFNKVFCLELYADFLSKHKRNYEAEEYSSQARTLRLSLPAHLEKLENLLLPDINLFY